MMDQLLQTSSNITSRISTANNNFITQDDGKNRLLMQKSKKNSDCMVVVENLLDEIKHHKQNYDRYMMVPNNFKAIITTRKKSFTRNECHSSEDYRKYLSPEPQHFNNYGLLDQIDYSA